MSSIYVFSYFPFGFEGRIWDLIVTVPDHCLSFYFVAHNMADCIILVRRAHKETNICIKLSVWLGSLSPYIWVQVGLHVHPRHPGCVPVSTTRIVVDRKIVVI